MVFHHLPANRLLHSFFLGWAQAPPQFFRGGGGGGGAFETHGAFLGQISILKIIVFLIIFL